VLACELRIRQGCERLPYTHSAFEQTACRHCQPPRLAASALSGTAASLRPASRGVRVTINSPSVRHRYLEQHPLGHQIRARGATAPSDPRRVEWHGRHVQKSRKLSTDAAVFCATALSCRAVQLYTAARGADWGATMAGMPCSGCCSMNHEYQSPCAPPSAVPRYHYRGKQAREATPAIRRLCMFPLSKPAPVGQTAGHHTAVE